MRGRRVREMEASGWILERKRMEAWVSVEWVVLSVRREYFFPLWRQHV